jgi:hypothetical protein
MEIYPILRDCQVNIWIMGLIVMILNKIYQVM